MAVDLPTQVGYDSDHIMANGEVINARRMAGMLNVNLKALVGEEIEPIRKYPFLTPMTNFKRRS
jgi:hypothetical protein